MLAFWFIIGRIIFFSGYILSYFSGFGPVRSIGFMINTFVNVLMLGHIVGYPLMNHLHIGE